MKLLNAFLSLFLLHQTNGQLACPDPLAHKYNITDGLTMHFDLVLNEANVTDGSIFCARIESSSTGWIGFGINPRIGQMLGAEAIIGIPANNTVKKYILRAKELDGVREMDEEDQTLMDTSITQDAEGRTTMSFTKYMFEDRYGIIPSDFVNSFIWALGSSNELGYHASRGNFGMDLLTTLSPVSAPPTTAAQASQAPSVAAGNITTEATSTSPTLAVVSSSPIMAVTASPALMGTAEGVQTTDSPAADVEATGAPVGADTTTSPTSAYVEVGSTSSPVAAVQATPSPVESTSVATSAPVANATTEDGLDFADVGDEVDAVASSERGTSGATSLTLGGLLLTAVMVLSYAMEF
jgi:hypothetical protein